MPTSALPPLPQIGQPHYIPLLIAALHARHATSDKFDSRIFLGILLVLVAGEKNLIVDVDIHSLIDSYRDSLADNSPSGDGECNPESYALDLKQQIKIKIEQAEEKVRDMVEFASTFCKKSSA